MLKLPMLRLSSCWNLSLWIWFYRTPTRVANWRGSAPATPLHERTERRSVDRLPDYMKAALRDGSLSTAHSAPSNQFMDNLDSSSRPRRSADYHDSFLDEIDLPAGLGFSSMDFGDSFEHSSVSMDSPRNSLSPIASVSCFLTFFISKIVVINVWY